MFVVWINVVFLFFSVSVVPNLCKEWIMSGFLIVNPRSCFAAFRTPETSFKHCKWSAFESVAAVTLPLDF